MYVYMILIMSKKNQTRPLQRINICFKIASTNKALFQDSLQIKPCLKTKGFKVMQGSGNRLLEGKNEKELLKRVLNLNFEHVIEALCVVLCCVGDFVS